MMVEPEEPGSSGMPLNEPILGHPTKTLLSGEVVNSLWL